MSARGGAAPRPFDASAAILLSGPPGSGKTTVGRALAGRLGLELVDLDAAIEAAAGATVEGVFASGGEARFRALEQEALARELARPGRRVIALGGGALVDPAARALALASGVVVQLHAPIEVLARRVARGGGRPLLDGAADPAPRLRALVASRAAAYREGHVHLDADRPAPVVASDAARAAGDRHAWVTAASGGYPVRLARDGAAAAAEVVLEHAAPGGSGGGVHLIADERVLPTWAGALAAALAMAGAPARSVLSCRSGEEHKRLAAIEALAEDLLAAGADRSSALVAAGGGVTSDLVGLLAALYFRGIPWIALPTTLLSMVDAAVGGKTAVDLPQAKNVLGAFHPPRAVVVDPAHARTEPLRQVRAGLAEAVKSALVGDPGLLDLLEREGEAALTTDREVLDEVVARALAVKIGVVSRDEREAGERAHLNLGHTLGHALEAAAPWGELAHGEAVAIGMVAALRVGEARGVTERGLAARIERLLCRLGLPTSADAERCRAARELVAADKKRLGGLVRFVAVAAPGCPRILDLPIAAIAAELASAAGRG
jgi:shikimate kinase/3-dehydroquinate synthase